jgi:hypothetical protein
MQPLCASRPDFPHCLFHALAVCGAARLAIVKRFSRLEVEITFAAAMVTAALLAQALTPLREITALTDSLLKFSGKTNAIGQLLSATRTLPLAHQPSDLIFVGW